MDPFEQVLQSNTLTLWAWVFCTTLFALVQIGKMVTPRLATTVAIAVSGIPIAILSGALAVFFYALWFKPSGVINTVTTMPLNAAAYFFETGGEFSLPGLLSILIFCIIQKDGKTRRVNTKLFDPYRGLPTYDKFGNPK